MTAHWETYVPRPVGVLPACPRCALQEDGKSSSIFWNGFHHGPTKHGATESRQYRIIPPEPVRVRWELVEPKYPWLIPLCRDCDRLRHNKRKWLKDRLALLQKNPKAVIGAWELKEQEERHGFIIPEYKVYQDDLKLPVERLQGPQRYTIAGQMDIEGRDIDNEIKLLESELACVMCRKENNLNGLWICDGCYAAWSRAGRPWGDDYVSLSLRRRWPEFKRTKLDAELYREIRRDLQLQVPLSKISPQGEDPLFVDFQLYAEPYPWRVRRALFHHFIYPEALMTPVVQATIIRGTADQVAAVLNGISESAYQLPEGFQVSDEMANVLHMSAERERRRTS